MNTNIKPNGNKVLVKKTEKKFEEKHGIILPKTESTSSDTNIGEVLAVGDGRKDEKGNVSKPSVKIGDVIVFTWGEKVELNGEELYFVSDESVLGVLDGNVK